ncbi:hypothetical protein MGYG_03865 [Nannizzia gypsea CBS 118893]|uniref:Nephrocystin 3-like N-terminal domain-containing protein n=1 Tax=Arthroderma gypseum (strain ATCC MYA-4604 / CBS 118893) TaxID=535722 RepID=E4UU94_ARTGP|nr:hypothetical protein MGYG_03865 [Nannizzia gypsea CBS 118893]EFR00861.1 hypothetical protein MGYG_03865 [Nannizzia gypsea CBS 118893]
MSELPLAGPAPQNNRNDSHASVPTSIQNFGSGPQYTNTSGPQYNNTAGGTQITGDNHITAEYNQNYGGLQLNGGHQSSQYVVIGSITQIFNANPPPDNQNTPEDKNAKNASLDLCLQSLAFEQMENRRMEIKTGAKGTCEWLFQHKTYKAWATSDRDLLWIKGKPGSGKSTLLHYVLEKAFNTRSNDTIILSFFFHGRGSELQKSPLGFYLSLLYQLLCEIPGAFPELLSTFETRCSKRGIPNKDWKWHEKELLYFFESSLPVVLKSRPVCLFVDALDECGENAAVDLAKKFNSWFKDLSSDGLPFHIYFTCRHYPIVAFECRSQICVEEENAKDISIYVHSTLPNIPGPVQDMIVKRASGVFMWARLVATRIIERDIDRSVDWEGVDWPEAGWEKVEEKIGRIPNELSDLYKQLVESIEDKQEALKLFQWVCFAKRPLSLDELRWVMIVDPKLDGPHKLLKESKDAPGFPPDNEGMKRRFTRLSCGLVEVVPPSNKPVVLLFNKPVVQFIHQSVKDFFVERGLFMLDSGARSTENPKIVVGNAHYQLFRTCICHFAIKKVTQSSSTDISDLESQFPLLRYAAESWMLHICQSDSHEFPQDNLLDYFGWPSENLVQTWERVCFYMAPSISVTATLGKSLLHVVSQYQMKGLLQAILERRADQHNFDINVRDGCGHTPLILASKHGHIATVQLLLHSDKANIDAKGNINRKWHIKPFSMFLPDTNKVDINAKDNNGMTPLISASRYGHEAIVKILLNTKKVDINAKNKNSMTPLISAACYGNEAIVKALLNTKKVDVNAKDNLDRTALIYTSKRGHEAIVKILLNTGQADINVKDQWGRSALIYASESGHTAVVEILLNTDKVDIDGKDKMDMTALIHASERGHEVMVKMLLNTCKADINAKDQWGKSALMYASDGGHTAVVEILLNTDKVDVNAKDQWGTSALMYASKYGYKAIVEILEKAGALD